MVIVFLIEIKTACTGEKMVSAVFLMENDLLLWLIFRQPHPNFINVRAAYASEIWAQLTKNHFTKSSTERFREYMYGEGRNHTWS